MIEFEIADIRKEALSKAQEAISKEEDDNKKLLIIGKIVEKLGTELSDALSSNLENVEVSNLDEIKLHLKKELSKAVSPLIKELKTLNGQTAAKSKIDQASMEAMHDNFDMVVLKKPKNRFTISNLDEIKIPESTKISNLGDLKEYFDGLSSVVKEALNIKVEAPKVNVDIPKQDAPVVNVEKTDLTPLISAINSLKDQLNKKPQGLDQKVLVKAIKEAMKNSNPVRSITTSSIREDAIKGAVQSANQSTGGGEGRKALSNAGLGVQVTASDIPCKWVDVSADTGGDLVVLGFSSSVQLTSATGMILTPGTPPIRINIDNVNKLYASGASGSALCFTYFS